jgi:hypothetical protein
MRTAPSKRILAACCLAALLCAPSAWAAKVNPDGTVAPAGNPDPPQASATAPDKSASIIPDPMSIIKKAADAQGDISPLTLKALQNDPKAMETVGRAPSRPAPAPPQRDGGPKSNKAMYGDIVIHK